MVMDVIFRRLCVNMFYVCVLCASCGSSHCFLTYSLLMLVVVVVRLSVHVHFNLGLSPRDS